MRTPLTAGWSMATVKIENSLSSLSANCCGVKPFTATFTMALLASSLFQGVLMAIPG